jgi:hypothetical protein
MRWFQHIRRIDIADHSLDEDFHVAEHVGHNSTASQLTIDSEVE